MVVHAALAWIAARGHHLGTTPDSRPVSSPILYLICTIQMAVRANGYPQFHHVMCWTDSAP